MRAGVDDAGDLVVVLGDVVDHERAVLVADELVDQRAHGIGEERGIATPQEVHAHAGASSSAASTSAVRRAPFTSCARRMRQPSVMPSA